MFAEVLKLMTASDMQLAAYRFRDRQLREVDIVLEGDDGTIAGMEVKAGATVTSRDFAGLRTMAEACKERFSPAALFSMTMRISCRSVTT